MLQTTTKQTMASNHGPLSRDLIGKTLTIGNKEIIDQNCNAHVNDLKASQLKFNDVVGPNATPCVIVKYIADEAIPQNRVIRASETTNFRVKQMKASDDNLIGIVGISTTEAAGAGDVIEVCTAGVYRVQKETGTTITRGDRLKKSASEDGRAVTSIAADGPFGVALESSIPDVAWTGDSDFNTDEMSFAPLTGAVYDLCFQSSSDAYAHSHGGFVSIYIDLWSNGQWVNVFKQNLTNDNELHLNTINVSFPALTLVSKIRFRSSPGQNQSFHSFDDVLIKFNCDLITACYIKNNM